ncbi:DNA-directed RNA polymerase I subunit RPA34 [Gastrophryne carolinensis]
MAGIGRFQCPLSFAPVAEFGGAVTSEPDTEIWLIKAPVDFTAESFSSHRLPLSGYKKQKVKSDGVRRIYHVLATPLADSAHRAFLHAQGEGSEERLVCAPPLQGVITVAEAYGDQNTLHAIPDRPPLAVPAGLKQRYQPFGGRPPRSASQSEAPESIGQSEESGKKKKKKAKKRRREESEDRE